VANQIDADAGIVGCAWARRDHNALGIHVFDAGNGYLIVAADFDLCPKFAKILNQVVGERVVIVENENHPLS
jgi:hypothetical protein